MPIRVGVAFELFALLCIATSGASCQSTQANLTPANDGPTARVETPFSSATPTRTPSATSAPATSTSGSVLVDEVKLVNVPRGFVSPKQFIYVDAAEAGGTVPDGPNESVSLNDYWTVVVVGQSADGLFIKVEVKEADPIGNNQAYIGLRGWIYSYWAGFAEPLLPAKFEVIEEPKELNFYRQPYFNYSLSVIGATMEAQGTARPDDYVLPALNATQTQWAVLQTPQP